MEDQDLNGAEGRLAEHSVSDGQAGTTSEGDRLQPDHGGRDFRRARQNAAEQHSRLAGEAGFHSN